MNRCQIRKSSKGMEKCVELEEELRQAMNKFNWKTGKVLPTWRPLTIGDKEYSNAFDIIPKPNQTLPHDQMEELMDKP